MSAVPPQMGGELPELWCRRLLDELRAAEEQVVVCPHRAGDGLERLAARWGDQGRVELLRPRDLRSATDFRRAIASAEVRAPQGPSSWFVAIGSGTDNGDLRSSLLPGQRLLVLAREEATEAGASNDDDAEREASGPLRPGMLATEIQHWADRRWGLDLTDEAAHEVREDCGGMLRRVELRLSDLAEWSGSGSGRGRRQSTQVAGASTQPGGTEIPAVEIELLGVPRIRWMRPDSRQAEELRWGYRGVLEVVSALAVAPEMQLPSGDLLERLWPALDPDDARKRLYPAVSHARRLFVDCGAASSAIVTAGGVYGLNPEWRWQCDVARLREAVQRSAAITDDLMQVEVARATGTSADGSDGETDLREILEAAWSSYRGDFLETLRTAWVRGEREEQRRNYLVVLRRLAVLRHAEPEAAGLEDVLRTILVADPIAEDAHVALMRLYARRGRADLVRRQYDRMCRVLMDDLGLQPMDRTVREVERLVAS